MTRSAIGGGAAALSMLAIAGCSTVSAPAAYPRGATNALDPAPTPCRLTGPPEVLARRVFVPRGVEALVDDCGFEVRFGHDRSQCLAIEWSSRREIPVESPCPRSDARSFAGAAPGDGAMLACESIARDPDQVDRGAVAYDVPPDAVVATAPPDAEPVAAYALDAPLGMGHDDVTAPLLLPLADGQYLYLWVRGGPESHDLRARLVTGEGDPVGPTLALSSPEVSVIGRASATLGPNGDGLVVYLASSGDEFDVFGTPFACAIP
jgi:hypothetical protein